MLTQSQFRKIEKWTPMGAKIASAILFVAAFGVVAYLVTQFIYEAQNAGEDGQKQGLASSLKSEKYLKLEGLFKEREKKKQESIIPAQTDNSLKKDPFSLP